MIGLFSLSSSEGYEKTHTLDLYEKISILSKKYKVNEKLASAIIKCESNSKPNAIRENKRKGETWSRDFSYFQINNYYHEERMSSLGLDIRNPDDNLEYGFMLLSSGGTKYWGWSKKCWGKSN